MADTNLYDPVFVRRLFDEMARTYGVVNMISSFGFARRWRRQCLQSIDLAPDSTVLDLMTGMGELCPGLAKLVGPSGSIVALDISPVMCERARQHAPPANRPALEVLEADALECPLADASVDGVVSTFGLKTFDQTQLATLARQVERVLRPVGQFAFLEISVPKWRLLRWPYMAYLHYLIPLIGQLALGNPDNYRLLGIYTQAFGNCEPTVRHFADAGLQVELRSYFFGCATGVVGSKPLP